MIVEDLRANIAYAPARTRLPMSESPHLAVIERSAPIWLGAAALMAVEPDARVAIIEVRYVLRHAASDSLRQTKLRAVGRSLAAPCRAGPA